MTAIGFFGPRDVRNDRAADRLTGVATAFADSGEQATTWSRDVAIYDFRLTDLGPSTSVVGHPHLGCGGTYKKP